MPFGAQIFYLYFFFDMLLAGGSVHNSIELCGVFSFDVTV
nr:MAG TPA: hypothetical protein [Caudoviricetes sp.]